MKRYLFLVILAVFIVPLAAIFPGSFPLWYKQCVALLFFLFLGMSVFLWDFNKYVSIFTAICLFSTYFVAYRAPRAIMLLFHLDLLCLAAYGISRLKVEYRKWIVRAVLGLVILQSAWLIMQAFHLDPFFYSLTDKSKDELVGLTCAKDQLGTFFALTLPVTLHFFTPLAILSIIGIFISKSSFAAGAGIVSGLGYLFFVKRHLFWRYAGVTAVITAVFFCVWTTSNFQISELEAGCGNTLLYLQ